jgi:hypothetical protein
MLPTHGLMSEFGVVIRVLWDAAQLLSLLRLSSLPSSQPNVLPPLKYTSTRTTGHYLGTFTAVNLTLFPLLNVLACVTLLLYLRSLFRLQAMQVNYI